MVCHRTSVVVLALLALILLFSSRADSMLLPTPATHDGWARNEFIASHRQIGSVLSPTGDPDEIATVRPKDAGGGKTSGEFGGLIGFPSDSWWNGRVGACSAFLRHLVYRFR